MPQTWEPVFVVFRKSVWKSGAVALSSCFAAGALAQGAEPSLPAVIVTGTPSVVDRFQLPSTTESMTADRAAETVNVMNTEDAFKYLPNVFIRKRHDGDTQAPMTTRTSGVGASARSLIFADGVLLSPPIANDNSNGGPRWGMVNPEEIERIDLLYGPFSAAYAGNSIGAVAEITTRMPERFEAHAALLGSSQHFSQYGTSDSYNNMRGSLSVGSRAGDFSWWISANRLKAESQPLAYVTSALRTTGAAGTAVNGAYATSDRNGAPIYVTGAGGFENQTQDNVRVKLAYDISPSWRVAYTLGLFQNETSGSIQSYLTDAATGAPVYSGVLNVGGQRIADPGSGFSGGVYTFRENHSMHSFSLRSSTGGTWDWEAVASVYRYDTSERRGPLGSAVAPLGLAANFPPAALNGGIGQISRQDGTGWQTLDLKGIWRPDGAGGTHQVSFGAHHDRAVLSNPVSYTSDWISGSAGAPASDSRGKTGARALWIQDVWRFAGDWRATVGGRYERWRAFDGYNFLQATAAGQTSVNANQPALSANRFSPKLSVAWDVASDWRLSGSLGKAYRFPTVTELYRTATVSNVPSLSDPNLKPENATSAELAAEYTSSGSRIRVSYFQERLADALLSQSTPVTGTDGIVRNTSVPTNVDRVESRGVEVVIEDRDVLINGLDIAGSLTFVDSNITADGAFPGAVGRYTPGVPRKRATLVTTYRHNDRLSGTVAMRSGSRVYSAIDNTDTFSHTYQGFDSYFIVDARIRYQLDRNWTFASGIDNLNNRNYILFHSFPQRTLVAELRYDY